MKKTIISSLIFISVLIIIIISILIMKPKEITKVESSDKISPIIVLDDTYVVKKGFNKELTDVIMSADDIDRNPKREIIGDYDLNTEGEYDLTYKIQDNAGNATTKDFTLVVKNDSSYKEKEVDFIDAIKTYKSQNTKIGIDVSKWQEDIDWKRVKEQGTEFAILRLAYQKGFDGEILIDQYFEKNYKECRENSIPIAVYYSSYDKSEEEVKNHANWICDYLNKNNISNIYVAFDWENWESFNKLGISLNDINNIADTFMNDIKNAGNQSMLYSGKTYLETVWKNPNEFPVWLANYVTSTTYKGDYNIWQFTQKGKISGINGYVDINVLK